MRLDVNKLSSAVRLALSLGVVAAAGTVSAYAQDAGSTNPQNEKGQSLDTIVVTGSRIRRVDIETSNPVITIDRAAIQQSGKLTVGDLVQDLPAIAGNAENPQVNNGGNSASAVSLRGLGSVRTLVLVNGHRVISSGTGSGDINEIPANLIERIEVLTDGASAIYGSDAVAGVVNFILRSNYEGAEFSADYGKSDKDDGERRGYSFTFGHTTDKGSIIAGVNYNKFDAVFAKDRAFSSHALYLSSGSVIAAGSSRTPNGRIFVPSSLGFGCGSVTRIAGAAGGSLADYRCYSGATDSFNFQAVGNYELTPQERTSAFIVGNYKLSDSVSTYLEVYHTKTSSNSQLAPLPFDASSDGVTISANNYYNPFGVDFGPSGYSFRSRFVTLGNRRLSRENTTDQIDAGFKGTIGDTSWTWDAGFIYGHFSQHAQSFGYVDFNSLSTALGPSFLDPTTGIVTCGTPGAPVGNCTPVNIFNIQDPATIAALSRYAVDPFFSTLYTLKQEEVNASGSVFDLPAGPLQLSVGGLYRKEYQRNGVDYIATVTDPVTATCLISASACSTPLQGGFNVKEFYAEALFPILKDVPFANSLNLTAGDRYSKYSQFGNSNNFKIGIEWRPIEDLLLRGTVSSVFRAPTIGDEFRGAANSAPQFIDPCINLVGSNLACAGVTGDGTFPGSGLNQTNAVVTGAAGANPPINLKPEQGKSFDYGFVYDPHWVEGLSFNADIYRIYLNDTIVSPPNAQTIVNLCFNGVQSGAGSPFCSLIHRFTSGPQSGQVDFISEPVSNLGRLDTKGVDFGAKYRLPETFLGNFAFTFQSTYIAEFNNDQAPGQAGDTVAHIAGHYDGQFGNIARWRALSAVNWNFGPWNAMLQARYIGPVALGYLNTQRDPVTGVPGLGNSADGSFPNVELHFGSITYLNLQAGYNIEPFNTRIDVGVDNVADRTPPLFYQTNVVNGNVDASTYDTIGRFYWARVTVKF